MSMKHMGCFVENQLRNGGISCGVFMTKPSSIARTTGTA